MEPGEWARKALDIIESETRDLVYSGAPTPTSETEVEIAPLVQKVGAISIAEIETMIGELQAAKDFLESEGERVQREAEHYTTLTQMASASVKIISDTVAGWRQAGHPLRDHSRISPIRSHTLPSRGQHQFGALAGSASAATPATDSNPDPSEATP
jgi:prophage DNA circulation protein